MDNVIVARDYVMKALEIQEENLPSTSSDLIWTKIMINEIRTIIREDSITMDNFHQ